MGSSFELARVDKVVPQLLIRDGLAQVLGQVFGQVMVGVPVKAVVKALRRPGLHHGHVWSLEFLWLLNELVGQNICLPGDLHPNLRWSYVIIHPVMSPF